MNNFNILCEEWDQNLHTTWTYKKQKRLILEILKICPTAKSFIDIMSKKKLPYEIVLKVNLCDPNFNRNEYIEYLKNYIVKYSSIGKFILSTIIGYGIGLATFYGTEKVLKNTNPTTKIISKDNKEDFIKSEEGGKLADKALDQNTISTNIGKHPHITSFGIGLGAKLGSSSLAYKFLDKLDKDRI